MRNYIYSLKSEGHAGISQFEGLRDAISRNDAIAERADNIAHWPGLESSSLANGINGDNMAGVAIKGKYHWIRRLQFKVPGVILKYRLQG